jgi:hypothetical protein
MYRRIIKLNFPSSYTILCYDCNCVRGKLGYCHRIPEVTNG